MDQFLVPQFIDVEPKILGPLTLRQFIIVVVGIVFAVLCYKLADLSLFVVEFLIIASIVILFAFIKINGQPFHYFLLNILAVMIGSNVRIWTKDPKIARAVDNTPEKEQDNFTPKEELKANKLSELSLLLDTGGAFQSNIINEKFEGDNKKEDKK